MMVCSRIYLTLVPVYVPIDNAVEVIREEDAEGAAQLDNGDIHYGGLQFDSTHREEDIKDSDWWNSVGTHSLAMTKRILKRS
jgi:hypothetical protein